MREASSEEGGPDHLGLGGGEGFRRQEGSDEEERRSLGVWDQTGRLGSGCAALLATLGLAL